MKKLQKVPSYYNRVTPLSKVLAMFLFIVLPFVGFYLGVQYEKSTIIPSTQNENVVWKKYEDPDGFFSFEYPSNWRIDYHGKAQDDKNTTAEYKSKKDITVSSIEGTFDFRWVDSYGGMCGDEGYEQIQLKNETTEVCHQVYENQESWWQISRPFDETKSSLGFQLDATADAPVAKNREILLRMISSLDIHKK